MPEIPQSQPSVTKVTEKGYGTRIVQSFKATLIGLLLFLLSFGVLYWNEGRTDISKVIDDAVAIGSEQVEESADLQGSLISTYGTLDSTETLSDSFVQEGPYLHLSNKIEMFAWHEQTKTSTETKIGGKEVTTTEYFYNMDWTTSPADSSSFEDPVGHTNPSMALETTNEKAATGTIGVYNLDVAGLVLPGGSALTLTAENTKLPPGAKLQNSKQIYIPATTVVAPAAEAATDTADDFFSLGEEEVAPTTATADAGTVTAPKVGDIRISYSALTHPVQNVTVTGRLNADRITPHYTKKNDKVYKAYIGSAEDAVSQEARSHKMSTWFLRIVGFFMMYIGLASMLGPLSVVLSVLPIAGGITKSLSNLIAFIVALALSIVTIIISAILHNIWAVIIIVVALVAGGYYLYNKKKDTATPVK